MLEFCRFDSSRNSSVGRVRVARESSNSPVSLLLRNAYRHDVTIVVEMVWNRVTLELN